MAGVYVHIPFCVSRCIYCGFFSTTRLDEAARYVVAVCRELRERSGWLEGAPVRTVYIGGGTPSCITADQLGHVIDTISEVYGMSFLEELTVECNPDDITLDYVCELAKLGVNRISMGVQTFDDGLLRLLHRRHTSAQALDAVRMCIDSGISNISIDLMYALPGQTLEMFRTDLETVLAAGVQHISSYCLSYEANTPLQAMSGQGILAPTSDELCAQMFTMMCKTLREGGFEHYEISNFSKPGCFSRHNSSYWDGTPYLGVGAAAHSYNGQTRRWNPSDLNTYMIGIEQGMEVQEEEQLSVIDLYNERIMLSLRTSQGLNISTLTNQDRLFLMSSSEPFILNGSLLLEDNHLRIPESSMFISDAIISSLFKT